MTILAMSLIKLVESCLVLFFIMNFTCVFRKQRDKDVSKYHIQLCCALIGMLLVFVKRLEAV